MQIVRWSKLSRLETAPAGLFPPMVLPQRDCAMDRTGRGGLRGQGSSMCGWLCLLRAGRDRRHVCALGVIWQIGRVRACLRDEDGRLCLYTGLESLLFL